MKVSVLNMAGKQIGEVELPPSIFEANINRDLMHQALVRQLSNGRRGTHKTKTRSEVNRTTAKWYRQKGTGRARHGSKRAPIFVGGGVAHGPKPRSYNKDMPRKMRRAALRSALSVKARDGEIVLLDDLKMDQPKTKELVTLMKKLTDSESVLILTAEQDRNVELSARNAADMKALRANYLNIRDLLGHNNLVMPLSALDVISGNLGQGDAVPAVSVIKASVVEAEEEEE